MMGLTGACPFDFAIGRGFELLLIYDLITSTFLRLISVFVLVFDVFILLLFSISFQYSFIFLFLAIQYFPELSFEITLYEISCRFSFRFLVFRRV